MNSPAVRRPLPALLPTHVHDLPVQTGTSSARAARVEEGLQQVDGLDGAAGHSV